MFQTFAFPRQKTRFTCGPAVLAAVANLLGKPVREEDIARALGSVDVTGTDHRDLARWAQENLPVASRGEGTYAGGLAIANIRNPDSGVGHFVLFLGERAGQIRYYCPLLGKTVAAHPDAIDWRNSDGTLHRWSVNFSIDLDFSDLEVEPERHVFFLADPAERLDPATDNTLLLKARYDALGTGASWHTPADIFMRGPTLYLSGVPVFAGDIVWLRPDPVGTPGYYAVLQQLCHVRGVFLNAPGAILTGNDKRLADPFRADAGALCFTSPATLAVALRHLSYGGGAQAFVVKPPNLFGGRDVLITADRAEIERHGMELVARAGCALVERHIAPKGPVPVDTSVTVTWDRMIGAISRTARGPGDLTPFHRGSAPGSIRGLTAAELHTVAAVQEMLRARSIFWAGLDFLEDTLVEVNISCPGALRETCKVYGKTLEDEVIASADKYARTQQVRGL